MAAETTGVGVVTILFFDAPQPIKNFLFNTNESRVKNEERRKMAFFSRFAFHSFLGRTEKAGRAFICLIDVLINEKFDMG